MAVTMADTKEEAAHYNSPSQGSIVVPADADWTEKEELRARIKLISSRPTPFRSS